MYNRYWSTAGGGEVHAGSLAESLARHHDVELLCETAVDTQHLDEHLGLSLSGIPVRVVGEISNPEFERITSEYDAFFNCTFSSSRRNRAAHGFYLVYFPPVDAGGVPGASKLAATAARYARAGLDIEWGEGLHGEEREGLRRWRWTEAEGVVRLRVPRGRRAVVEVTLSTAARPDGAEAPAEVWLDGRLAATVPFSRSGPQTVRAPLVGRESPIDLVIRTTPFRPIDLVGIDDTRSLGVQIERIALHHDDAARRVMRRVARPFATGAVDDFLETYDALLANSQYTAAWIRRLWGRRSFRLEPPVRQRAAGTKQNMILSVGRFFGPDSGHSKRQLEMIEAFRVIARSAPEWRLHLVGGCSIEDAAYLRRVEEAAIGLPVEFHINAPRNEVDQLYAEASIYWQATGLGEDPKIHPERFEHFGIAVVEAMAAGAAPIVVGVGGPSATVRKNRDGLHFRSSDELIGASLRLIRDAPARQRLAASAVVRARDYNRSAFDRRVDRVVELMR